MLTHWGANKKGGTLRAWHIDRGEAGGYQDVVKEVGLEPAIKLAKKALPRVAFAKEALRAYLFVALPMRRLLR